MNAVVEQPRPDNDTTAIIAVIERVARDNSIDVDKMERLLAMQERVLARHAEEEFNRAMSLCQQDMGRISTDANNPQTSSRYASFAQIDRALRPLYTKHGFALSFGEGETPKPEHVRVTCIVTHRDGFSRSYFRDMPVTTTGMKGNVNMTPTHANAAAQSYASRYLVKGIFNVAIGEDDKDGNGGETGECISEKQAADLLALLTETGANIPQFKKWAKITELNQILAKNYDFVVKEVRTRAEARK